MEWINTMQLLKKLEFKTNSTLDANMKSSQTI